MTNFSFIPLQFNWVAIHPQPQGLVQFVGGFFWGTFPTLFYRKLLQDIYHQGYTIIVKPYLFTPNHWKAAIDLAQNQIEILEGIIQEAKRLGYSSESSDIYRHLIQFLQEDPKKRTLEIGNYYWLGHSLGCKYIALLELLTDLEKSDIQTTVKAIIGEQETQQLLRALKNINLSKISLKDQASILIAPVIADLEAAIPFAPLKRLINRLGIKVIPSKEETHNLIINSKLFGLINLIELGKDDYAKETVNWFRQTLLQKVNKDVTLPNLVHSSPIGFFQSPTPISEKIREILEK